MKLAAWGQGFDAAWEPDAVEVYWASMAQTLAAGFGRLLGVISDYAVDVAVYGRRDYRERIQAHVGAQITAAGAGRVLVAHSLGSVIALDLCMAWLCAGRFRRPRAEWPVAGLVTLGSPLGLQGEVGPVDEWLNRGDAAALMPYGFPAGFRWVNFADRNDPVVTGTRLGEAPNFETIEGYQRLGVEQRMIDCGGLLDSHTSYLEDPEVISTIHLMMRGA
jgi:hypothetical protein